MPKKSIHSEVRAYNFILNDLVKIGWTAKNPSIHYDGEIWTQNECLSHPEIKKFLILERPENIVKVNENVHYIIEAKATINELDKAISEAVYYADKINKSKVIIVRIASGVAGNPQDGYYIKSRFFKDGEWKDITVNKKPLSSLVSKKLASQLLNENTFSVEDIKIEEQEFINAAERINDILLNGAIHKDYRARVISALLLSILEATPLNLNEKPDLLIKSINARVNTLLQREGKPEFSGHIELTLPATTDNHFKFKNALVKTLRELDDLNIRAAFDAGTDVLGKFYEVFLKYGNGAREIGIVLTPRHVTHFAAEVLDITGHDLVFDPACGTGGFLVAAFDYVKKHTDKATIEKFKKYNLFGIDQQDFIVALALVNMIFRGDGKTNIIEGNSLSKWLNYKRIDNNNTAEYLSKPGEGYIPPITKVLMNPPFAQEEKEFHFITHALKQMQDSGILFCVLPKGVMVKQGKDLAWRKGLLSNNTLLSVINLPEDLFYPTGTQTCAIIVRKGIAHSRENNVLWVNVKNDGLLKSKGKRLPSIRARNDFEKVKDLVKMFIKDNTIEVENIPLFQKACIIDFDDKNLELLPEVYLDANVPTSEELLIDIERTLKTFLSSMIQNNYLENFKSIIKQEKTNLQSENIRKIILHPVFKEINIQRLFASKIKTGEIHVSGVLDNGIIPLISCSSVNAGVEGFFEVEHAFKGGLTIACDGSPLTAFFHYYDFTAKDNVLVCQGNYRFTTNLFIVNQVNGLKWRFNYGRKCYENKIHKINIFVPMKEGGIDEDYIEHLFRSSSSWNTLAKLF